MQFHWIHLAVFLLVLTLEILTVLHILLTMRDDSERASLWLILVILLPVFGILLYLVAGISRRPHSAGRLRRRHRNGNLRDPGSPYGREEDPAERGTRLSEGVQPS